MPITVEWVRYGRPAAEALRTAIATAKLDDPLAPVTVVVPSNHIGVSARRLLASGELGPICGRCTGMTAVTFLTVFRLAELLGAAILARQGRRPVSTPLIAAALRASLKEDAGVFAAVADRPATEAALVSAYKELRDIPADALERLATQSPRAADVVRLHRAARARLEADFSDEEDLIATAIALISHDGSTVRELGSVVVHLPQRLSLHAAALLRAAARATDVLVLAGATGDRKVDAAVRRSVSRLVTLNTSPPPDTAPAMPVVSPGRTLIITASDADEEVRAAVRAVIDEARRGTPLERMALLYASAEPYARLIDEQLSAAGIAHNGAAVMPVTARVAGRTLLGLLALPASGFHREDVFAWLTGARLRHQGRPVRVATWERISRESAVVAGRDQWDRLLSAYARGREAEAGLTDGDPEAPVWLAESLREKAEHARTLREFVLGLIDDLAEAANKPKGWAEQASWARRHLNELLGGERCRSSWPLVEQKAAERVERALDRLACLEAVEGPVAFDVFARTLQLELEADLGRVGRIGEGALVGTVGMGAGLDLDFVVVLGLAESSFPPPTRDDSLLPDQERSAAAGGLALRCEETERRHCELLATLAGTKRHLLCMPRGDLRRSNELVPSRWLTDIASELAGERLFSRQLLGSERPWLSHIASYDAGLHRATLPATEQEHRLRSLLAARS
ncbi:MAG TPA: hypothetical protein VED59_06120, partial [Acidimicrobiales bacterium]|nr:hypothetical protein [Acidimicrobiales bacterium]